MNCLLEKTHEHFVWIAALIIMIFIAVGCQSKEVVENATWDPVIEEIDGFEMAKVPSGCFMMGDPALERAQPVHEVCITESFWIDLTEVSNGQFDEFGGQAARDPAFPGQDISSKDLPRTSITWDEAEAFCQLRDGRLPTEAEWEYAARGPDAWTYPWGNNFDPTKLNFCDGNCPFSSSENSQYHTADDGYVVAAPVNSFPEGASWVGALNMSGNVAEWVRDFFNPSYYEDSPRDNPTGPENGQTRVLKSSPWSWWMEPESFSQSANRWNFIPDATGKEYSGSTGFRCVRSDR
ncbi:MAG: SUMF1/EgtB/PvdO family nonheme iron enzyme [Anaerolineales bacterium]|jgi:formylglycine-generating enzyme required for sulfatase activity